MAIIYKVAKAKFPFTMGITKVLTKPAAAEEKPKKAVSHKQAVKKTPKAEEPVEEVVVPEEPAVPVETVEEVSAVSEVELVSAGFSEKSIQLLNHNSIFTVEQLKASLNAEPDITKLPKIGKTSGNVIIEELTKWETEQQKENL